MLQFVVICEKLPHFSDDRIREIIRHWWPCKPKKGCYWTSSSLKATWSWLRKLRSSENFLINCTREKTCFIYIMKRKCRLGIHFRHTFLVNLGTQFENSCLGFLSCIRKYIFPCFQSHLYPGISFGQIVLSSLIDVCLRHRKWSSLPHLESKCPTA